jgi:arylformamidase
MFVYPGDPEVRLERVAAISQGDLANTSRLDFGVHSGTHIDAPAHFVEGAASVEAIPLEQLVGPVQLVDATEIGRSIDAEAIDRLEIPKGTERVLFKTTNSKLWERDDFSQRFVRLSESAALRLVELGLRLVGIDYLSIGDESVHRALLGAGVIPLEGLDLRVPAAGRYRLICLPLMIVGSDGAPARVLIEPL